MTSDLYTSDPNEEDSGGVHTNSGVGNKAAYLIAAGTADEPGGSFNGQTISGIGVTKAADIYYRVETVFLTSGSDYGDLGEALPQACDDLIGTDGITAGNCTQVGRAVTATEMESQPTEAADGDATAPEAPAATCPAGQEPRDLLFDDMEDPASDTNWTTDTLTPPPPPFIAHWGFDDVYAHSGTAHLFGEDSETVTDSTLEMAGDVTLPAGRASFLRFDHAYEFESEPGTNFDGGVLEISTDGGSTWHDIGSLLTDVGYNGTITDQFTNPLGGRDAFVNKSHGYRSSRATLTSLAGRNVRFRFRIGTDDLGGARGWFIDDVRISTCGPPGGTGPTGPAGGGSPTGGGTTSPPPVVTPPAGTPAATLASVKVRSCKARGKGKKLRVKCRLRSFGAVKRAKVKVTRKGKTVTRKTVKPSSNGTLTIKPARKLKKGTYKVTITLIGSDGKTRKLTAKLKVR
jgi:hypothetical protein